MQIPGVHAVIPMKALARCKTRLSPVMESAQRELFTLWMLDRVAEAATAVPELTGAVVLGGDARIQDIAERRGLCWRPDTSEDLNQALNRLYAENEHQHWDSLLYLAGDLPRLQSADIRGVVEASSGVDLVLAPAARGGTNMVLARCDRGFTFRLGAQSYRRHVEQAALLGIDWRQYSSPATHADVDTPADLDRLQREEPELWELFLAFSG